MMVPEIRRIGEDRRAGASMDGPLKGHRTKLLTSRLTVMAVPRWRDGDEVAGYFKGGLGLDSGSGELKSCLGNPFAK